MDSIEVVQALVLAVEVVAMAVVAVEDEDVLYSITGDMDYEKIPDFIGTEDVIGVNAGMFFFRNSEWSRMFLDRWWNATGFICPPGQSKSGENDALKHLIKTMPQDEKKHVRIPRMQCVFNSNMWSPSWKSSHRLMTLTKTVWQEISIVIGVCLSLVVSHCPSLAGIHRGVYAKGDFM
ncbi:hypothetical protein KI387_019237, partial [Taxus chinensis]